MRSVFSQIWSGFHSQYFFFAKCQNATPCAVLSNHGSTLVGAKQRWRVPKHEVTFQTIRSTSQRPLYCDVDNKQLLTEAQLSSTTAACGHRVKGWCAMYSVNGSRFVRCHYQMLSSIANYRYSSEVSLNAYLVFIFIDLWLAFSLVLCVTSKFCLTLFSPIRPVVDGGPRPERHHTAFSNQSLPILSDFFSGISVNLWELLRLTKWLLPRLSARPFREVTSPPPSFHRFFSAMLINENLQSSCINVLTASTRSSHALASAFWERTCVLQFL